jgi:hypothetical protein
MRSVLAAAVSAARQGQSFLLLLPAMSKPSAFSYLSGIRVVSHQGCRRLMWSGACTTACEEEPVRHISHRLKNVAHELAVPVIAVVNVSGPRFNWKAGENREKYLGARLCLSVGQSAIGKQKMGSKSALPTENPSRCAAVRELHLGARPAFLGYLSHACWQAKHIGLLLSLHTGLRARLRRPRIDWQRRRWCIGHWRSGRHGTSRCSWCSWRHRLRLPTGRRRLSARCPTRTGRHSSRRRHHPPSSRGHLRLHSGLRRRHICGQTGHWLHASTARDHSNF